jgi:hypothetical protein
MVSQSEKAIVREPVISPPNSELLRSSASAFLAWPEISASSAAFGEQISQHEHIVRSIHDVLDASSSPTTRVEELYSNGTVSHTQLVDFYDSMTCLLSEADTERLLLYLPFEYVPRTDWTADDMQLQSSLTAFRSAYLNAWYSQLSVHDARANFIDGDVLEVELRDGDLPRVVKAAQLAPMLVAFGMIRIEQLEALCDNTADPLLRRDLQESLAYLYDQDDTEEPRTTQDLPPTTEEIKQQIDTIFKEFTADAAPGVTQNRLSWLRQEWAEAKIQQIAQLLSGLLTNTEDPAELIADILSCADISSAAAALVDGTRMAIETDCRSGSNTGNVFDALALPVLDALCDFDETAVTSRVQKLLHHAYQIGAISGDELTGYGCDIQNFTGDLSDNLRGMPHETQLLRTIVHDIETNEALSAVLHPVITVGGSRLKGYGQEGSDLDIAVFVRPEVTEADASFIRECITELFVNRWQQDQPIEIWLEGDRALAITAPTQPDIYRADENWTHLLFNSAWIGSEEALQNLRENLLPRYFIDPQDDPHLLHNRRYHLERIEQDILQYRLMHKGYDRYFPRIRGKYTPVDDRLDGCSTFWDPGYRRLATKLFVEKVFLPKM